MLFGCLWLAACGGGDDQGFPNRIQPDIAPDGTKALRMGNGAEPQSLDPAAVQRCAGGQYRGQSL